MLIVLLELVESDFACMRAGAICYACLSELFSAQTISSRLSENNNNSPLSISRAHLSEGLSPKREKSRLSEMG